MILNWLGFNFHMHTFNINISYETRIAQKWELNVWKYDGNRELQMKCFFSQLNLRVIKLLRYIMEKLSDITTENVKFQSGGINIPSRDYNLIHDRAWIQQIAVRWFLCLQACGSGVGAGATVAPTYSHIIYIQYQSRWLHDNSLEDRKKVLLSYFVTPVNVGEACFLVDMFCQTSIT